MKAGSEDDFALDAWGYLTVQEHRVNLYGGIYEGIRAGQSSAYNAPRLYNLLSLYGYFEKENGTEFTDTTLLSTKETLTVKLDTLVEDVKLTTTAPREGYTATTAIRGNSSYSVVETSWMVSNSGEDGTWKDMQIGETFVAGKYYKVYVDLKVASGYSFAIDELLDPAVIGTINGYSAKVTQTYDQVSQERITVQYNFGICNKTVIESVIVENITLPVVGENPSYTCGFAGSGYGYYNEMDNGTIIQNGIRWYDVTNGYDAVVWYNDTFEAGHTYKVEITARVQDGFNFANSVFATVNGDGNVTSSVNNGIWCTVTYTVTCKPRTVKSLAVTGLEVPVGGNHPDFDAVTDSDYYTVESIVWYDYQNDMEEMTESDTFIAGGTYYIIVTVVPVKENGSNVCQFVTGKTKATLNGVEVVKKAGWDEVQSVSREVNIWYTYTAVSEEETNFVTGQITGSSMVGDITLQLIPDGLTEPAYELIIDGDQTNYTFDNIAPGNYILKVTQTGGSDKQYNIVVTPPGVVVDVSLLTLGDADGDGDVDNDDAVLIKRYRAGLVDTSELCLSACDLDGNGAVDVYDAYLIQLFLTGQLDKFPVES